MRVTFKVSATPDDTLPQGTVTGRKGATCFHCGAFIPSDQIKSLGKAGAMSQRLLATVVQSGRKRIYLDPTNAQEAAGLTPPPLSLPEERLSYDPRNLWTPSYGLETWADLFTGRQLHFLTAACDALAELHPIIVKDALSSGLSGSESLEDGGSGARAYADAICTYLGLAISTIADDNSSLVTWRSGHGTGATRSTFSRQSISMSWDFAEVNPFSGTSGDLGKTISATCNTLEHLGSGPTGTSRQQDARNSPAPQMILNTDPPYYDNVPYANLSDYFYVWLRRSLGGVYPKLLSTVLTPKVQELIADPYRNGGRDASSEYFENGFKEFFSKARLAATDTYPMVVYYAFKQTESKAASGGWETILQAIIDTGWSITGTWPIRSEKSGRMISVERNALASSIVLALRPRPTNAPLNDRRGFIRNLQTELPVALRRMQQGAIAPVDLPQAAIGPGMAVFSRYAGVLEPDGTQMSVKSALARINEILDEVLNEQEGDFDPTSRFALAWYRQHGYEAGLFGDADNLARARNTSVATMDRDEILTSRAGRVQLLAPAALPDGYDVLADDHTSNWEALHYAIKALDAGGVTEAGRFMARALSREDEAVDADRVKELAHLLFRIAEDNGWTKDALSFNALVTSWPDIMTAVEAAPVASAAQGSFAFDEEEA